MSRLPDQDARDLILADLDHNFLVEAGAGSGKTTSLVRRITRLLSTGTCETANIAAVTFTRKAAAELRQRLQEALEGGIRTETNEVVGRRLRRALDDLGQAFTGTIHSFCGRLLRERPVEAGLGTGFEEIEGAEERLLMRRAWSEYLVRVRLEHPETLDTLDSLDISPADLVSAYEQIVLYPDVRMASDPSPMPDLGEARGSLARFLEVAAARMPQSEPENGWDTLQSLIVRARRWMAAFDLDDDRYFLRLLSGMDRNIKPTLNRWPAADNAREAASAFEEFRSGTVAPVLEKWRECRHHVVMEFLLPAARHYSGIRERLNKVNFQDLLMRTAAMLRDNPNVRAYFRGKYTRLFVDEFQDTDPVQAEIMFYLTGEDTAETDWTRLSPRNGSLFVVGDPKQSIYRFRRADIDTYDLVKRRIVETGGRAVSLTTNFRSVPGIVDWINPAFEGLFRALGPPYQPRYSPMAAVRDGGRAGECGIRRLDLAGARRQGDVVREDADRIADWIGRALDGDLALPRTPEESRRGLGPRPVPEDFMILTMFKRNMDVYGEALGERGIPYTISGESGIQRSPSLQEFYYLLRCLADPGDPVFLVAALRGMFFGVSDEQLYQFKRAGGRFCFLSPVPHGFAVFSDAWERLRTYWGWARDIPPGGAIEKIAVDLGLPAFSRAVEGRGTEGDGAGCIMQFIEGARGREGRGATGFEETLEYLGQLMEEGAEEDIDVEGGRRPGVRLMNVHKAKGLESPVVILANPSSNPQHEPDFHVRRISGEPAGYVSIRRRKGEYQVETVAAPRGWDEYRREEEKYLEAERLRLLYVAATRARDLLVVSRCPSRSARNPWSPLESFLDRADAIEAFPRVPRGARDPLDTRVPRLEVGVSCDAPSPAGVPAHVAFAAANRDIETDMEMIVRPDYRHDSVTSVTARRAYPGKGGAGRGPVWGRLVHRMLAIAAASRAEWSGEIPGILAAEQELMPGEMDELARVLRGVVASPFWRRVVTARERMIETPFGLFDGGVYLTGTIDLAFREDAGWVIADYKSDEVESEAHMRDLIDYYGVQVREYARRWEEITGAHVAECGLFFTAICEWRRI